MERNTNKTGWGNVYSKRRGVAMVVAKAEANFDFIIHERLGEIGEQGKYRKELRIVEWGRYDPKFDIRPWDTSDADGKRMNKGITLTLDEIIKLKEILEGINLEAYQMPEKKIQPKIE